MKTKGKQLEIWITLGVSSDRRYRALVGATRFSVLFGPRSATFSTPLNAHVRVRQRSWTINRLPYSLFFRGNAFESLCSGTLPPNKTITKQFSVTGCRFRRASPRLSPLKARPSTDGVRQRMEPIANTHFSVETRSWLIYVDDKFVSHGWHIEIVRFYTVRGVIPVRVSDIPFVLFEHFKRRRMHNRREHDTQSAAGVRVKVSDVVSEIYLPFTWFCRRFQSRRYKLTGNSVPFDRWTNYGTVYATIFFYYTIWLFQMQIFTYFRFSVTHKAGGSVNKTVVIAHMKSDRRINFGRRRDGECMCVFSADDGNDFVSEIRIRYRSSVFFVVLGFINIIIFYFQLIIYKHFFKIIIRVHCPKTAYFTAFFEQSTTVSQLNFDKCSRDEHLQLLTTSTRQGCIKNVV